MKTREQVEQRALGLFPIHEEFDVDRLKELREAYLQGWEEAQQDKCERSGHREQSLKAIDEFLKTEEGKRYISEMQANKQTCGFCVEPKQHQNDDGVYDDLSDVINNVNTDSAINMGRTLSIAEYNPRGYSVEDWKENAKEDYMRTPISVLKYITVLEEELEKALR